MATPRKKTAPKSTFSEALSSVNDKMAMEEVANKIFGEVNKKELEKSSGNSWI